jgi:hypothetical protein
MMQIGVTLRVLQMVLMPREGGDLARRPAEQPDRCRIPAGAS